MMRWLLVGLVLMLTGIVLAGVRDFRPEEDVLDELLAYQVSPSQGVLTRIPGGLSEISLTSWALVEPHPDHTGVSRYSYALDATVLSSDEVRLITQRMEIISRISGDPQSPRELGEYAARLVDGSAWLTDPRTQRIDVSVLGGQPGYVAVKPAPVGTRTVLVRLGYEEPRSILEQQIVERRLRPEQRRRLLGRAFSLGFGDLPAAERRQTLATWGRRIVARGREGIDYVTRGLLIGDYRDAVVLEPTLPEPADIGPQRYVAINLRGTLRLRVHGTPGAELQVARRPETYDPFTVGKDGTVDVALDGGSPRTIVLAAKRRLNVRFSTSDADRIVQIGEGDHPEADDGRVWLLPDVVRHRYLRLDPSVPVRLRFAPEQPVLGITLRALMESDEEPTSNAELKISYVGDKARSSPPTYTVDLAGSRYERTDAQRVTESRVVLVRPPRGVREIELLGSKRTLVSPFTREPGVVASVVDPLYDVPLDTTQAWRYAPRSESAVTTIRPINDAQLDVDGRIVKVRVQPRIETLASGLGERVAERVLEPVGHPIVRHVLRPSWYARGATVPQTAWLRLVPPEQGVLQQKVRARDAAVRLTYRVKPDTLGRVVRVDVPGREPTLHRVVSTVGELRFGVLPGTTDVSIDGLGSSDEAWMSAVPSEGGRIYRTQQICELPVGRTLAFRFDRRPGELLAILVFVVSESTSRQFEFNYDIDPGKKWEMGQRLYRRLTERSGSIHGAVEPSNRVLIWEAEREPMPTGTLPHAMGVVRIPLGDDLRPGDHKIQLAFTTKVGPPLWVRAVLVGRRRSSDWGTDE